MFKIFSKRGLGYGLRYKNNGDGEDLENYQLDDGDNDSQTYLLTRYLGTKRKREQFYSPGVGSLRTRTVDAMSRQRREG